MVMRLAAWQSPVVHGMQALTDIARESLLASKRIYPAVSKTRLLRSDWLSELGAANVYLKLENEQVRHHPAPCSWPA